MGIDVDSGEYIVAIAKKKTVPKKNTIKKTSSKTVLKSTEKKSTSGTSKKTGKSLLIVESPAKAKTIKKYLGSSFIVQASVGHIKDLPKSKLGVDLEHEFLPEYVIIRGKSKVVSDLKKAAKEVESVYLAPDPDREGEAIAWHIAEELKPINGNIQRVLFNEITQQGIRRAMENPLELNEKMYDAQQSRRIVDRLVGYQISPLLWKKVQRGLSAGRVQSVAVRMIVEREVEIENFVSVEYWSIHAELLGANGPAFKAKLQKIPEKPKPFGDFPSYPPMIFRNFLLFIGFHSSAS